MRPPGGRAAAWRRTASCGAVSASSAPTVHVPEPQLCTDNAAMIASAARYGRILPYPHYLALDAYATGETAR